MITGAIYIGRDNSLDFHLTEDGEVVDLAPVSRMTLDLRGRGLPPVALDSAQDPQAFDWQSDATRLKLKLGAHVNQPGEYLGRLTVFSLDHPNGLVWTEALPVPVRA